MAIHASTGGGQGLLAGRKLLNVSRYSNHAGVPGGYFNSDEERDSGAAGVARKGTSEEFHEVPTFWRACVGRLANRSLVLLPRDRGDGARNREGNSEEAAGSERRPKKTSMETETLAASAFCIQTRPDYAIQWTPAGLRALRTLE